MKHTKQLVTLLLTALLLACFCAFSVCAVNDSVDPAQPGGVVRRAADGARDAVSDVGNAAGNAAEDIGDAARDAVGAGTDAGVREGNGNAVQDGEISDVSESNEVPMEAQDGEVSDKADNVDKAEQTGTDKATATSDTANDTVKDGHTGRTVGIVIAILIAIALVVLVLLLIPKRKD